jgi:predicted ABC-type ATPase
MPVLHLVAGPNGAGKTTFFQRVLGSATHLPFINADEIAKMKWPGAEVEHGYDASRLAEKERARLIAARRSFATETVFSHPSKLELVRSAKAQGYLVHLHVVLVPLPLAVARVALRSSQGGHLVPVKKVRQRFRRLWGLIAAAIELADEVIAYDNTLAATPFREVARYVDAKPVREALPTWSPLAPISPARSKRRSKQMKRTPR